MTRFMLLLGALGLDGCPMPGAPQSPAQPVQAGVGCPTADNIHVASYMTRDEHDAGAHTGWVLPLHDVKVATLTGLPEYATIDQATAGALGVPQPPASVWLVTPGQRPCRATIGPYYGAAVDAPTPNVTYGVELSGCAAPPKEQQQDAEAIALVSEAPPTECQILSPQPVAARLGEIDAQKNWQRPTKETPIPPALAAAIPPHDCQ